MMRIRDLLTWAFGWRASGTAPPVVPVPPVVRFNVTFSQVQAINVDFQQAQSFTLTFGEDE